jgi:hypothetical protein
VGDIASDGINDRARHNAQNHTVRSSARRLLIFDLGLLAPVSLKRDCWKNNPGWSKIYLAFLRTGSKSLNGKMRRMFSWRLSVPEYHEYAHLIDA